MEAIFVFGSNEAGRHGGGAARFAAIHHGAEYGNGEGLQGTSYAIPTKDHQIETLSLDAIRQYVGRFVAFAESTPGTVYHVTQIGCGLAGLTPEQIAPMFADAPANCQFSTAWAKWLPNHATWTDQ